MLLRPTHSLSITVRDWKCALALDLGVEITPKIPARFLLARSMRKLAAIRFLQATNAAEFSHAFCVFVAHCRDSRECADVAHSGRRLQGGEGLADRRKQRLGYPGVGCQRRPLVRDAGRP